MPWPPPTKPKDPLAKVRARQAAVLGRGKKPKVSRAHPEDDLQITVADYLRLVTIAPARWWFCPNGGNLSKAQSAKFQRMGLTPGVSDLHFVWDDGDLLSRFGVIELKSDVGRVSPDQSTFLADMLANGHQAVVCRTLDEVIGALRQWGFPMKEVKL